MTAGEPANWAGVVVVGRCALVHGDSQRSGTCGYLTVMTRSLPSDPTNHVLRGHNEVQAPPLQGGVSAALLPTGTARLPRHE
jgi:hypothetical protein